MAYGNFRKFSDITVTAKNIASHPQETSNEAPRLRAPGQVLILHKVPCRRGGHPSGHCGADGVVRARRHSHALLNAASSLLPARRLTGKALASILANSICRWK